MPVEIHGREYNTVAERLVKFHEKHSNGAVQTEIWAREEGEVVFKALVWPDIEKEKRFFTGFASEKEGSSPINKSSYIENCETSAVGRALAFAGFGADASIASADDVANAMRQENKKTAKETNALDVESVMEDIRAVRTAADCDKYYSQHKEKIVASPHQKEILDLLREKKGSFKTTPPED